MKILYLTDQTYLHGGIEKVLSQKANFFADVMGDEVVIVTYNQKGLEPMYRFSHNIIMTDLGVNYEIGKSYFHPVNLKKVPNHRRALSNLLQQQNPDVVISCSYGPDFYFIPYVAVHIPKIKEFHSSRFFSSQEGTTVKEKLLHKLNAIIEARYDQLVVLNEDEKHFYRSRKITVIPNPVENSIRRANLASKKILAAGRISPVKNFGELIDVFSKVCREIPDWELHLWGSDYLGTQKTLQDTVKEYGMQDRVKFMGITDDLKKEMENYSIYAMTSETECFPMVLLEALSVGLPVISYDSPTGPKHIINHESDSLLIPYKNSLIFADQLKRLMLDEECRRQFGINGILNSNRFEMSKVMKEWKELLKKLIAG